MLYLGHGNPEVTAAETTITVLLGEENTTLMDFSGVSGCRLKALVITKLLTALNAIFLGGHPCFMART